MDLYAFKMLKINGKKNSECNNRLLNIMIAILACPETVFPDIGVPLHNL